LFSSPSLSRVAPGRPVHGIPTDVAQESEIGVAEGIEVPGSSAVPDEPADFPPRRSKPPTFLDRAGDAVQARTGEVRGLLCGTAEVPAAALQRQEHLPVGQVAGRERDLIARVEMPIHLPIKRVFPESRGGLEIRRFHDPSGHALERVGHDHRMMARGLVERLEPVEELLLAGTV
jgi:hypothetical protein